MSKYDKLINNILAGKSISYDSAEKLLVKLGFHLGVKGSHHVFSKPNYSKNVSLKKRSLLLSYQIRLLQEVLKDHGY